MQALGMSPSQASQLVTSQGDTNVSSAQLTKAVVSNAVMLRSAANAASFTPDGSRLPITPTVNPSLQLLGGDANRVFLLIQNNEPSGGATLLISFDPITTASPGYYLNFGPGGFGILFDQNCPNNPIYAGWSGSPTVGGVLMSASKPVPPASGPPSGAKANPFQFSNTAGPSAGF
jgi:hypothetical protein